MADLVEAKVTTVETTAAPTKTDTNPQKQITETTVEVTPGARTSEFWLAALTTVVGLGLLVYGAIEKREDLVTWGGILSGVSTGAYSAARGLAKK